MSSAGEVLVFVGRIAVLALAFTLETLITAVTFAHSQFPQVTNTVFLVVGVYLGYRFIKKVIRMWISFLLSTIKTILTLLFIGVLFAIYLRGFHRFFTRDIYFILDMCKSATNDFDYKKTSYQYATKMAGESKFDFLRRGAQTLFGNADLTSEQMQDFREEAEDFIADNIDGVKDFLLSRGAYPENLNNFFRNL